MNEAREKDRNKEKEKQQNEESEYIQVYIHPSTNDLAVILFSPRGKDLQCLHRSRVRVQIPVYVHSCKESEGERLQAALLLLWESQSLFSSSPGKKLVRMIDQLLPHSPSPLPPLKTAARR